MNFENIMLTEGSHSQKVIYYMTPFKWNVQSKQIHADSQDEWLSESRERRESRVTI